MTVRYESGDKFCPSFSGGSTQIATLRLVIPVLPAIATMMIVEYYTRAFTQRQIRINQEFGRKISVPIPRIGLRMIEKRSISALDIVLPQSGLGVFTNQDSESVWPITSHNFDPIKLLLVHQLFPIKFKANIPVDRAIVPCVRRGPRNTGPGVSQLAFVPDERGLYPSICEHPESIANMAIVVN
jgi:hypothetical protein